MKANFPHPSSFRLFFNLDATIGLLGESSPTPISWHAGFEILRAPTKDTELMRLLALGHERRRATCNVSMIIPVKHFSGHRSGPQKLYDLGGLHARVRV